MSNYAPTGNPVQITRAASPQIRAEFVLISTAVNSKGDIAGQTWTGTHDYSGGVLRAALPVGGSDVATKAYADNLVYTTVLPGQSLGFLSSTGSVASFGQTHTGYAQKEVKGADIVCAATIDLTVATGNLVHITGSTGPITAITVASGAEYTLVWDSTPTITHNATTLILPSAANITVASGDVWKVRGDGSGNARVVSIIKASGQPFVAIPYLHVREEQTSGTSAGSAAATANQVRILNTVVTNTISGASLASNIVTIPAGTYEYEAAAPVFQVDIHRLTLRNDTDSTDILVGQNGYAAASSSSLGFATVNGRFTITSSKGIKLNHYTQTAGGFLGRPVSLGTAEIYSSLQLWKVA